MTATISSTESYSAAEPASRSHAPLLIFADDWGRHPSSCQHLARHLLHLHEILWVNTIGTRTPRFDLNTFRRGYEKLRQWSLLSQPEKKQGRAPRVLNPRMWPWFSSGLGRTLNRRLLTRQLAPVIESLSAAPIAVTTLPIVADLIGLLPVERWVYYCVDDFGEWPGLDQAALKEMEKRLVERADILVAVSENLQQKLARMGRAARLLTHGVDLEFWSGRNTALAIPQLDNIPRPLVVFWGVIDGRMDVAFIRTLAEDLTAGTIVLAGPIQDPDPKLFQHKRVVHVPPLPYEQLPQLAREAGVLIMPYADLPVTRAIQPLKLKEYLATRKPSVVRNLPSTESWADCLDLVDTPRTFSERVRYRLRTGTSPDQESARFRLAQESWEEKARLFERWIGASASFVR